MTQYPYDIDGLNEIILAAAVLRDSSTADKYLPQILRTASDDSAAINQLLNNMLFAGLTEASVAMTRDAVKRFPNHAYLGYQGHRVLLWSGDVDEARSLVEIVRRSNFPESNLNMMLLRQACAEGDLDAAEKYYQLLESDSDDVGGRFVVNIIYGYPQQAHQLIIDADLDLQGLGGFLGYPYFDHKKFPALVAVLEPQGISPLSIDGPPYACKHSATTSSVR